MYRLRQLYLILALCIYVAGLTIYIFGLHAGICNTRIITVRTENIGSGSAEFRFKGDEIDENGNVNFGEKGSKATVNEPSFRDKSTVTFCRPQSQLFLKKEHTDVNNKRWPWNQSETWDCPNSYFSDYSPYRWKANLDCTIGSPQLVYTLADSIHDIEVVEPDNRCLQNFVLNCCYDKSRRVPNVLHYVMYGDVELGLYTFVSFMSAVQFMKPCAIIIHGTYSPKGTLWNYFISVYPNVIVVKEEFISEIFGQKLAYKEHGTDVMRIRALQTYGGVYMDWDEILVRPIDQLRVHPFVMSLESTKSMGNQFIMGERNATFLSLWHIQYMDYRSDSWDYNSIHVPYHLSRIHPGLIHVENYTCIRTADPMLINPLWDWNADWSRNYALHIYTIHDRLLRKKSVADIRKLNNTVGALCRYVLYGRKEVCK